MLMTLIDETDKTKHNTFHKQLNKTNGVRFTPVHKLSVKEIKLAKTHSIIQAKLFWGNQSLHNILHLQIH